MKQQPQKIISIILIALGVLLFIIVGGLSIWSDLEASLFNSAKRSRESLSSLNCPSFISSDETGIVSASFYNPSEKTINPKIQTFVSDGYVILMQEKVDVLDIEPGETKTVEIKVSADNAVYNRIVLVRMHQFAYRPLPYRNGSCGIYVIDIPFLSGRQFVLLSLVLGFILSGAGIMLWGFSSQPIVWDRLTRFHQMIVFILLAITISIVGLLSLWFLGVILMVLWFLLTMTLISQVVMDFEKNTRKKGK